MCLSFGFQVGFSRIEHKLSLAAALKATSIRHLLLTFYLPLNIPRPLASDKQARANHSRLNAHSHTRTQRIVYYSAPRDERGSHPAQIQDGNANRLASSGDCCMNTVSTAHTTRYKEKTKLFCTRETNCATGN